MKLLIFTFLFINTSCFAAKGLQNMIQTKSKTSGFSIINKASRPGLKNKQAAKKESIQKIQLNVIKKQLQKIFQDL
jgi:hypothetical protein